VVADWMSDGGVPNLAHAHSMERQITCMPLTSFPTHSTLQHIRNLHCDRSHIVNSLVCLVQGSKSRKIQAGPASVTIVGNLQIPDPDPTSSYYNQNCD
jgi:hypothetical protein